RRVLFRSHQEEGRRVPRGPADAAKPRSMVAHVRHAAVVRAVRHRALVAAPEQEVRASYLRRGRHMALSTDKKLYIAVGVLVVLGGALYVQKQNEKKEQASYTLEGRTADLPKLDVTDEKVKTIDKIVLEKPAGDAGAATKIVLQKQGEEWQVAEP